ncbi:MAG: histidine phosphatase family protein [Nanoarchaeota archaeon]|nr:histidine phosphatase family protein [Nanoarchaeota archaeon]
MKIILVRHGESRANAKGISQSSNIDWHDTQLSRRGKDQAKHLGRKLKDRKIDLIYVSDLKRARQTAEILSGIIGVPVKEEFEGFREYPGKMLRSRLSVLFNRRLKKLRRFLKELSEERDKNKTVLIVAHGITNRIILGHLLELPMKKQLLYFQQDNSCINIIEWSSEYGNWRLDLMNDVSHLPDKLWEERL